MPKEEIIAAVWPSTTVDEANLAVQVSALRRVLDRGRSDGSCIQTVPGRGYRFVVLVERLAPNGTQPEVPAIRDEPSTDAAVASPANGRRSRVRLMVLGMTVAAVAGAGATGAWLVNPRWWGSEAVRPSLSVVVLPFATPSQRCRGNTVCRCDHRGI